MVPLTCPLHQHLLLPLLLPPPLPLRPRGRSGLPLRIRLPHLRLPLPAPTRHHHHRHQRPCLLRPLLPWRRFRTRLLQQQPVLLLLLLPLQLLLPPVSVAVEMRTAQCLPLSAAVAVWARQQQVHKEQQQVQQVTSGGVAIAGRRKGTRWGQSG